MEVKHSTHEYGARYGSVIRDYEQLTSCLMDKVCKLELEKKLLEEQSQDQQNEIYKLNANLESCEKAIDSEKAEAHKEIKKLQSHRTLLERDLRKHDSASVDKRHELNSKPQDLSGAFDHIQFPALREFVGSGKPVWGTCAGLIFLANKAVGQKTGGQELVGGLDCTVHRNFFGSQLQSFETELSVPKLSEKEGGNETCRGVFIRAPAILEVGPDVEILADCPVPADRPSVTISFGEGTEEEVYSKDRVIVAVRQGSILATAFHPELTSDSRWHRFFLDMDKESQAKVFSTLSLSSSSRDTEDLPKNKPLDLPIFE